MSRVAEIFFNVRFLAPLVVLVVRYVERDREIRPSMTT
jgi:hypothetical protein